MISAGHSLNWSSTPYSVEMFARGRITVILYGVLVTLGGRVTSLSSSGTINLSGHGLMEVVFMMTDVFSTVDTIFADLGGQCDGDSKPLLNLQGWSMYWPVLLSWSD